MSNRYRGQRFDLKMAADQSRLAHFLTNLEGEDSAVFPTISIRFLWGRRVGAPAGIPVSVPQGTDAAQSRVDGAAWFTEVCPQHHLLT